MTSSRHDPSNPASNRVESSENATDRSEGDRTRLELKTSTDLQTAMDMTNAVEEKDDGALARRIEASDRRDEAGDRDDDALSLTARLQAQPSSLGSPSPVGSCTQEPLSPIGSCTQEPPSPVPSPSGRIPGNDDASHRNVELLCASFGSNSRRGSNQANLNKNIKVNDQSIKDARVKALFRIGEISLFTLDDAINPSNEAIGYKDESRSIEIDVSVDEDKNADQTEAVGTIDDIGMFDQVDMSESAEIDDRAGSAECDRIDAAPLSTRDENEIADARMIPFSEGMLGKDELNLAEFPISLLCEHAPVGQNTIEFHDQVRDSSRNRNVVRKLTVTASEKYGLPTVKDDDVILCLIQLSKEALECNRRTIRFSPSQILQMLGWPDKGQNYKRVALALHRWLSVSLHYENSWWDKATQDWTTRAFHVIESFEIGAHKGGRGPTVRAGIFTWSETVFQSFQAGYIKRLDFYNYLKLRLPTSKRMYRFLDKRFYHGPEWDFDLRQFAHEHIGLSRSYTDNGKLKEKLNPAIDELTEAGFIEPLPACERYTKVGRSAWRIRFSQRFEPKSSINRMKMEEKVEGEKPLAAPVERPSLGEIGRGISAESARGDSAHRVDSARVESAHRGESGRVESAHRVESGRVESARASSGQDESEAPPLLSSSVGELAKKPQTKPQTKARFKPQPSRKAMRREPRNEEPRGLIESKQKEMNEPQLKEQSSRAPVQHVEIAPLASLLIDRGISEATARDLVATFPAERIEKQIEAFDYLVRRQDKKISRSPAGYLVKAIQVNYAPPTRFETAEAREKRLAEADRNRIEIERKLTESVTKRHSEWDSQVEAYWKTLSPERQKEVETEALDATNGVFRRHYEKQQAAIRAGKIQGELTLDYRKAILTGYIEKLIEDEQKGKEPKA